MIVSTVIEHFIPLSLLQIFYVLGLLQQALDSPIEPFLRPGIILNEVKEDLKNITTHYYIIYICESILLSLN